MTPQPMPPSALATLPTANANPVFPTPDDLAQLEHETGYPRQKIMEDVQRTGATSKESLYPAFYGQESKGIPPGLAQAASGMGGDEMAPEQNGPGVIPGEEELESPQRAQARAAMAGEMSETPADEAAESPEQQAAEMQAGTEMHGADREALATMARRPRSGNVRERARKMSHRF